MRQIQMTDETFKFLTELLEDDKVQRKGMSKDEDHFMEIYNGFHKKKRIVGIVNKRREEIITLLNKYYKENKPSVRLNKIISFECLDTGGAHCLDERGAIYLLKQLGLI